MNRKERMKRFHKEPPFIVEYYEGVISELEDKIHSLEEKLKRASQPAKKAVFRIKRQNQ